MLFPLHLELDVVIVTDKMAKRQGFWIIEGHWWGNYPRIGKASAKAGNCTGEEPPWAIMAALIVELYEGPLEG